ncbi:FAD-dependent oxidoreductase [Acetobacteraceae bacterium H6797]|nr:FAD-dependent oxidoreductase [Acetobacteraceae bacterium H6797]
MGEITILGAGLAGLCTAWFLRREGADVRVLERAAGAGLGTSFANGGMLTPSQANPWNAPGVLQYALSTLGKADSPMLVRPTALPGMMRWGTRFALESKAARYEANARRNLALGLYSLEQHRALVAEAGIDYARSALGTLQIFRDEQSLDAARAIAGMLAPHGLRFTVLDEAALLALEPALAEADTRPIAGIHFPDDESGDAHLFCRNLANRLAAMGVVFEYGVEIEQLETKAGRVSALIGPGGRRPVETLVVAAAAQSLRLLGPLGLRLPIYPVKGYSLSGEMAPLRTRPRLPIVDMHRKIALTPLGSRLRIAGSAEFNGFDTVLNTARTSMIRRDAEALLPALRALPEGALKPWTGLRAVTPTGYPVLGATAINGLFTNTGHGPLGWTFAAGTGRLVAEAVLHGHPAGRDLSTPLPARAA